MMRDVTIERVANICGGNVDSDVFSMLTKAVLFARRNGLRLLSTLNFSLSAVVNA
jgi:hypothetical protein